MGFEPTTLRDLVGCSNHLSYWRLYGEQGPILQTKIPISQITSSCGQMKFWRRWDWVVLRILLKDVSSEIFQLVFKHLVYVQLKPVNKYKIFRSFHQCTCYITRWHCFGCSYYVLLRTDAWQNLSLALAKKRLFYVWVVKHASQKTQNCH